ncbi:MAG: cytochrome c class [Fibrobacteria bacterium]|jgi:high-affinity iron transporter|nr:cytochrome c class [Fibrobacteria bacterium]
MSESRSHEGLKPVQEYGILALLVLIAVPLSMWMGLRDGLDLVKRADWKRETAVPAAAPAKGTADAAPPSTPEGVKRGEAVFQANCVACHGSNADGKGPAAVAFTPPPRDFTDPKAKWTQGRSPAEVFATIAEGVQGTGMAGFAASLSEAQRWDLTHYIRSLPGIGKSADAEDP